MFNTDNIEINAAFYELFENIFHEDFFTVLADLRPTNRIKSLREKASVTYKEVIEGQEVEKKKTDMTKLDEEEQRELIAYNMKAGGKMKKYTPRIAYIGTLLHKKQYHGSYDDFLKFLASCDVSDFVNPTISAQIWEKINVDQAVPDSVKNA